MNKTSLTILRVSLGITFLWIGLLIFKEPTAWAGYLQLWAVHLLPIAPDKAIIGTAIFDLIVGALLVFDTFVWLAALFAATHMVVVLTVSGITDITVRDIAILGGALGLMIDTLPESIKNKIGFGRKVKDFKDISVPGKIS